MNKEPVTRGVGILATLGTRMPGPACALWATVALWPAALLWPTAAFGQEELPKREQKIQERYFDSTLAVRGSVIDSMGNGVAHATVQVGDHVAATDASGVFHIPQITRGNYLLSASHGDFRTEILPIALHRNLNATEVALAPLILDKADGAKVRFLFGGDVAFGRRFIDPFEATPRDRIPADDPNALIQVSDPEPGTRAVVHYIRPYYQEADWGVVNLETPVTQSPVTPHLTKDYAFFTLPGSLPALKWLGVDYVSLGNNHLYDYLDLGIDDTLRHLADAEIPNSGGGRNSQDALRPYRTQIKGLPYSFVSATSITGDQHQVTYVATRDKGGAADLTDASAVGLTIARERQDGFIPIVQIHAGVEYTFEPGALLQERFAKAVASGAALVVAHHPHVAQGVGLIDGKVVLHSLGNLAFDQARLETMLGLLARVDMQGEKLSALRLLPVYLEDFRPRPIGGDLAARFLRRIGEFSRAYGALVYPYHAQGWVALDPEAVTASDRTVEIDILVPAAGTALIDLRGLGAAEESLAMVSTDAPGSTLQVGRDLLLFGDMEDWDSDEQALELSRWDDTGDSKFPCTSTAYRGIASLCSMRSQYNTTDSVVALRNRVRVMGDALAKPNKNLTVVGYLQGQDAGPIKAIARYYASEEKAVEATAFGEEVAFTHPGGTFPWQQVTADLHMPPDDPARVMDPSANARALRLFLRHGIPACDKATVAYDEFAIVNWEEEFPATESRVLVTPHARDFLRLKAPPGRYRATLTFRAYRPAAAR